MKVNTCEFESLDSLNEFLSDIKDENVINIETKDVKVSEYFEEWGSCCGYKTKNVTIYKLIYKEE